MPIFDDLDRRLDSPPFDRAEFERRLPDSIRVAQGMALLHVRGSIIELIKDAPHVLPVTGDSGTTRTAEEHLGLKPSVYFFAGRAYPGKHGRIVLAFSAAIEDGRDGSVTPFDTGGLVHPDKHLKVRLSPTDDLPQRIEYGRASEMPLKEWRLQLARLLAAYFESDLAYWTERPHRPDPDDVFVLDNQWRAWSFEVRLQSGPSVFDSSQWCCDEATYDEMRRLDLEMPSFESDETDPWERFWNASQSLVAGGTPKFREHMETWVRKQVGL